jgi:dTMP kinase
MEKKCQYIVIEGTDGVGKTTQTQKLVDYLRNLKYKVLQTKEPGSEHAPLTMELRNIMLNAKYDTSLTVAARELISLAIRSIHLEKVIIPAQYEYDFIIQDRGILSGLAYGEACGNDLGWIMNISNTIVKNADKTLDGQPTLLYDKVIVLSGNAKSSLHKAAQAKQEFTHGDAIENKGVSFMESVGINMLNYSNFFNTRHIDVDGKNIDEVFSEIINTLNLEGTNAY